jgi:parallel beta-helix repeat protein
VDTCGQQLSAPGNYHLTGDLSCASDGVVITANDVAFTLAGYTISGVSSRESCDVDQPQLGVRVEPGTSNVRVSGGTVNGFVDGVMLYGTNSRVSAMTITNNCVFGIAVSSDGNVVDTNAISGSGWDGIVLAAASHATIRSNDLDLNTRYGIVITESSDGNTVHSNILRRNGLEEGASGGGILVAYGNDNVIHDNAVNGNFTGILLSWPITGTTIGDNTVTGNVSNGISIAAGSSPNTVNGNTIRGNGVCDASDGNAGANTWTSNIFGTSCF